MRLSLNWLKDFVEIKETPEQVADVFTMLGFEVETIEKMGAELEPVISVEILKIKPHPNADRLKLVQVFDGKSKHEIICGANNIKVGQTVPLAGTGVTLPNGMTIESVKIRGIKSAGMLCSSKELGLGADSSGIYILGNKVRPGQSLKQILGLNDTVLDLAVTPNRADCFSVIGLAREYAAKMNRKVKYKSYSKRETSTKNKSSLIVKVGETKLCHKYTGKIITDVKVCPSPDWIQHRLLAAGVRPINNVVDATNYIMLETGQPLHAFDADKLFSQAGKYTIVVRKAKAGEKLVTLGGQSRQLNSSILIIADQKKPIAIAGVMGGAETEVSSSTRTVILETASFDPLTVRKASQHLGLRSDSSTRYEKGLDVTQIDNVANSAAGLISDLAKGKVNSDGNRVNNNTKTSASIIKLDVTYVQELLGCNIPSVTIKKLLICLGFEVSGSSKVLTVRVPSWRLDVKLPADLVEEVGRLYGYNNLEPTLLTGLSKVITENKQYIWTETIRDLMIRLSFSEIYSYSFYDKKSAIRTTVPVDEHYRVDNPLNPGQEYLRTSLWPRLQDAIKLNLASFEDFRMFEIGRVFYPGKHMPKEQNMLAGVIVNKDGNLEKTLIDIKGVLFELNQAFSLKNLISIKALSSKSYELTWEGLGKLGMIYLQTAKEFLNKLVNGQVGFFEIHLSPLIEPATDRKTYQNISTFPTIKRDLAVIVPESVKYISIAETVCSINKKTITKQEPNGLIAQLDVFGDVYRSSKLGQNKKSIPIRFTYQSQRRTLKGQEVDNIQKTIITDLQKKYQAQIRGA
ncbi:phenylalanine--tRNA ligase subunit beta [Patescibacteria group bacterium]|nr:phenylalanine--tRNA ligase subunit beta [Patescibacteria group bacterium]MBU1890084.1 phenylalanine--tRNA ligase subunit beta [Patescibacteria group bacterium]